jgi:hypothetical protein
VQGPQGETGPSGGPQGDTGVSGTLITGASGAPSSPGVIGQFYIDFTSGWMYQYV